MNNRTIAILVGFLVVMAVGICCVKGAARMADNLASVPTVDQQLAMLK